MLISVRKARITMVMHMVKYSCSLLGPGTLKSDLPQEKFINWVIVLHAGSDAIILG